MTEPTPTEDELFALIRSLGYTTHGQTAAIVDAISARWSAQPAPAASPVPLTADDLKEPKNGEQWRVEWWNESCRMLLPADKKLDSFQSYKNGTLMFTIKDRGITKGA